MVCLIPKQAPKAWAHTMGLDMYLTKRVYVGANYEHRNITGKIELMANGEKIPVKLNQVSEIIERVAYWRKANAIHKWFVDNCQDGVDDCREAYVDFDKLKELLALCKKVKGAAIMQHGLVENGQTASPETGGVFVPNMEMGRQIANAEEIHALLPTESGFFFGSTDYDNYYMDDIESTIEQLEAVMSEPDADSHDYRYRASW